MALVLVTAPLGLIGVTAVLLATGTPFGFVATLGTIALSGIIMRNSVILVDQIKQDIDAGSAPWDAVIDATVRRARPITLTAAAAILAMIPLAPTAFWGPMAVAMMGGLAGATLLTLLFLPALYAAVFRIHPGRERATALAAPITLGPALVARTDAGGVRLHGVPAGRSADAAAARCLDRPARPERRPSLAGRAAGVRRHRRRLAGRRGAEPRRRIPL